MGSTRGEGTDPFGVYRGLFRALSVRRRAVHVAETAQRLLGHEDGVRNLVGEAVDEPLVRGLGDPADWVAVHGEDLAWVHPRYR